MRSETWELRELGPDSADEACEVMHRAFARHLDDGIGTGALHETPQILRADLETGTTLTGLFHENRLVAMVKSKKSEDGSLYFARLAVLPEVQGLGCAGRLVRHLRRRAQAEGLAGLSCSVRAGARDNIAMYRHLGMRIAERREFDSLNGEVVRAVIMRDDPEALAATRP